MQQFKPGDVVVCVDTDPANKLSKDKTYVVTAVACYNEPHVTLEGVADEWRSSRFKLLIDTADTPLLVVSKERATSTK